MEVASPPPVPFGRGSAKRHYPGSPGFVDATNRNPFAMISGDSSDEYMQQRSFKRRRFTSTDEMMGGDTENNQNQSFVQFQQPIVAKGNYTISSHGPHSKRSRTEHQSTQQINELQNVVNSHGAEIESLKSDKVGLEESLNTLKTDLAQAALLQTNLKLPTRHWATRPAPFRYGVLRCPEEEWLHSQILQVVPRQGEPCRWLGQALAKARQQFWWLEGRWRLEEQWRRRPWQRLEGRCRLEGRWQRRKREVCRQRRSEYFLRGHEKERQMSTWRCMQVVQDDDGDVWHKRLE